MIEAILAGNLAQVCQFLDEGISPDVTDKNDIPALVIAALEGCAEIVEVLLAAGATWDNAIVQDSLTVPSDDWGGDRNIGAVTVWAAAKADHPNVIQVLYSIMPQSVQTVLIQACEQGRLDVVKTIMAAHDMSHYRTYRGPLQIAIQAGQLDVVKHLVEAGMDLHFRDELGNGETPLEMAAMCGQLEIARYLVSAGATVDQWMDGDTPLVSAAYAGQVKVYQYLYALTSEDIRQYAEEVLAKTLQRQERERKTDVETFIEGAAHGQMEIVKWGIGQNLEINAIGSHNQTALMYAASYGLIDIVEILLEAGADPNIQSDEESYHAGSTALMKVVNSYSSYFAGNAHKLVERLIAAGANVNIQDRAGNTALIWAIAWPPHNRPNIKIIQSLLVAGADLNLQSNGCHTALAYARQQSSQNEAFTSVLEMVQRFLG